MTRRQFVATSFFAASYPCYFEPRWLRVTHAEVHLSRVRLPEPIRILQLSDLHLSWAVPLSIIDSAITAGLKQQPDIICLTGDFITGRVDLSSGAYAKALSRLSAAAPTFAVLGNHDGGVWAQDMGGYADTAAVKELLRQSGIQLLHNSATAFRSLSLVGVGDLWSNEVDA